MTRAVIDGTDAIAESLATAYMLILLASEDPESENSLVSFGVASGILSVLAAILGEERMMYVATKIDLSHIEARKKSILSGEAPNPIDAAVLIKEVLKTIAPYTKEGGTVTDLFKTFAKACDSRKSRTAETLSSFESYHSTDPKDWENN